MWSFSTLAKVFFQWECAVLSNQMFMINNISSSIKSYKKTTINISSNFRSNKILEKLPPNSIWVYMHGNSVVSLWCVHGDIALWGNISHEKQLNICAEIILFVHDWVAPIEFINGYLEMNGKIMRRKSIHVKMKIWSVVVSLGRMWSVAQNCSGFTMAMELS